MLEMKIIIATLLRKLIIKINRPVGTVEIAIKMNIALKLARLMILKFEKRYYLRSS